MTMLELADKTLDQEPIPIAPFVVCTWLVGVFLRWDHGFSVLPDSLMQAQRIAQSIHRDMEFGAEAASPKRGVLI